MTKEWQARKEGEGNGEGLEGDQRGFEDTAADREEGGLRPQQREQAKEPGRRSIVNGFENVKKELAILSPLSHSHVVKLYGVILRPIGMVLELAPKRSLKKILTQYKDVHAKFHIRAMQRVFLQVMSSYGGIVKNFLLHSCNYFPYTTDFHAIISLNFF